MELPKNKKIYFASDNHLGLPNAEESRVREKHFVSWLDEAQKDAAAIYLLGDLFDFWFEYKTVVPKGFVRVLGKIAEMSDLGIPIIFLQATMIYGYGIISKKNWGSPFTTNQSH